MMRDELVEISKMIEDYIFKEIDTKGFVSYRDVTQRFPRNRSKSKIWELVERNLLQWQDNWDTLISTEVLYDSLT